MDIFSNYSWPGNVRELRNILERMLVLHGRSKYIMPEHLPEEFGRELPEGTAQPARSEAGTLADAVSSYERQLIEHALLEANGVQTRAAQALGTTRRILKYRMEKLNIGSAREEAEPSSI